jgi:hypothetical protein
MARKRSWLLGTYANRSFPTLRVDDGGVEPPAQAAKIE